MRGGLSVPQQPTPQLTSPNIEALRKWLSNPESGKNFQAGSSNQIDELLKLDKIAQSNLSDQLKAALVQHNATDLANPTQRSAQGSFN